MNALRHVLCAGLAVCLIGTVQAAPITLTFTGTVTQTPNFDPGNPFGDPIDTGTTFAGSYTFDPAAADGAPDAATGAYAATGAPHGLSVSFGSPGVFSVDFGDLTIGIGNDFSGADFYTVVAPQVAPGDGLAASMILIDDEGSVFGSDALPAGAPVLGEFEFRQFMLFGTYLDSSGATTQIEILGTLDTLACTAGCTVPEPGSLALLIAGAAAGLGRRRRSGSTADEAARLNATEE